MTVTQSRLNSFRKEVDSLGNLASEFVGGLIDEVYRENPNISIADMRKETIQAINDSLYIFGDQAAELACELFDEVVAERIPKATSQIYDVIDPSKVEDKVRYLIKDLVEGNGDKYTRNVLDLTRFLIHRSAFDNMIKNCEHNKIRYARVPSGRETCSFCFMLSSRGFVYKSEKTAHGSHGVHAHCDCVIVPGFADIDPNSQIEGYKPTEMKDRLERTLNALGYELGDLSDNGIKHELESFVEMTFGWGYLTTGKPGYSIKLDEVISKDFTISNRSFGKKFGEHHGDFGLKFSDSDRQKFREIIDDIVTNNTNVVIGKEWRGQDGNVIFYIRDNDVVVCNKHNGFITVLENGVNQNSCAKNAILASKILSEDIK